MLRGTGTIFWREVGQYFASPVAYLIAFALLLLTGLLFNSDLTFSLTQKPADPALIPSFLALAMVFFAPLLTMRMLAEESREGTLELLLTAPVSDTAVVIGKFLSAWFYYTILLLLTFTYQFILLAITQPDLGLAVSAYIGIWLYGGATLAVGLLFSSLTENQIVAAFLSMSVLLLLWLGDIAGEIVANLDLARVLRQLSLGGHFSTSFAVGLLRAEDVAYYAGIMVVMLFITTRIVESHRWR
ncbi:MAG: ABC transporter permease [Chloroflexi bacterium]|nr:ABC transporter permease [Chloroflexota bacterium]